MIKKVIVVLMFLIIVVGCSENNDINEKLEKENVKKMIQR